MSEWTPNRGNCGFASKSLKSILNAIEAQQASCAKDNQRNNHINFYDENGNIRPLSDIMCEMEQTARRVKGVER